MDRRRGVRRPSRSARGRYNWPRQVDLLKEEERTGRTRAMGVDESSACAKWGASLQGGDPQNGSSRRQLPYERRLEGEKAQKEPGQWTQTGCSGGQGLQWGKKGNLKSCLGSGKKASVAAEVSERDATREARASRHGPGEKNGPWGWDCERG
ncbi:hypothetical protein TRVL_04026 [Trypanosoma vivax]|nr:hypothetical protein TRVL_04026 [Trypanosoma vivax]